MSQQPIKSDIILPQTTITGDYSHKRKSHGIEDVVGGAGVHFLDIGRPRKIIIQLFYTLQPFARRVVFSR